MTDITPRPVPKVVPPLLGFVAGYVDSCTFLGLFGLFVAQMTGSFVLAGTQFVTAEHGLAVKLLAIPAFFFGGCATTVLAVAAHARGRSALAFVLGFECLLLTGLMAALLLGGPFRSIDAPAVLLAALTGIGAMGVQSAMVRLLMSGVASTNVMTTNTTQLAVDATLLLLGRWTGRAASGGWSPAALAARGRLAGLIPIGLGFVAGTALGAVGYEFAGFASLAVPVVVAYALLVWAVRHSSAAAAVTA